MDRRFVSLLAEPSRLRAVGHTLHDESLEVRLVAVPLLGQLSELNPAVAMPLLRRALLSLQKELCTADLGGPSASSSRRREIRLLLLAYLATSYCIHCSSRRREILLLL
eukprot:7050344-Prymnesium_polylepis.1